MAQISINIKEAKIQEPEIIVGIDLGTTNSLVAIYDSKQNKAIALTDEDHFAIVPSIIHFDKNNAIIVGNAAREKLISNPERTIYSIKRLMGKSYSDIKSSSHQLGYKIINDDTERLVKIQMGEKFYSPIELSSFILIELKQRAEKLLQKKITKAVITVPAYFNDAQRQSTRDAGKLAGLDVLRIINEPTAASLAYGIGLDLTEEKTIAVYDLGGGTFDVSLLKLHEGIFEVLSTNGDTFLGGDDLDRCIMEHWIQLYSLQKNLNTDSAIQALRLLAEKAKKHLSTHENFSASFLDHQVSLDQLTFEKLITPFINLTIDCCKKAIQDAKISKQSIQEIILVGGSTRTPLVKKMISDFFEQPVNDTVDPDEAVALGAAIQADILAGNQTDILLLDITPLSLGIETMGALMDVIIPRNSKVPSSAGRQYTTSIDGQKNLLISVYQGERDLVKNNRKLAEFILHSIPSMPAGLPKIEITFQLNADGILKVRAKELRSGLEQTIEVKPQYGLTEEEMSLMLIDSIKNAKEDMQHRGLIEAKVEAENMLQTCRNFIQKNKQLLSQDEIDETEKLIEVLQKNLYNTDKDIIHHHIEILNDFTRPFAERIMDVAINKAMKGKVI